MRCGCTSTTQLILLNHQGDRSNDLFHRKFFSVRGYLFPKCLCRRVCVFIAALIATLISFLTSCSLIPCAFATSLIMFFIPFPPMSYGEYLSLTVIVIPQPICRSPAILVESINFSHQKKKAR